MSLYLAQSSFPSCLTSLPVSVEEKHCHSIILPPSFYTKRFDRWGWWASEIQIAFCINRSFRTIDLTWIEEGSNFSKNCTYIYATHEFEPKFFMFLHEIFTQKDSIKVFFSLPPPGGNIFLAVCLLATYLKKKICMDIYYIFREGLNFSVCSGAKSNWLKFRVDPTWTTNTPTDKLC